MKMLQEADIQVIYRKESEKTRLVIEVLSQTHKRLRVKYADRKIFLSPFIQLLINPSRFFYKDAWTARSQAIVENAAPARRLHGYGRRSQHSEPGVH